MACGEVTFLYQNRCINACPDTTYGESNECRPCQSPCVNCSSSTACKSCVAKHILNVETCEPCPDNCDECSNKTTCTTCDSTFKLHNSGCVANCPPGYLASTANGKDICISCVSCAECETTADNCTKCGVGTYLYNNKCPTECPDTFYENGSNNECTTCVAPCVNCIDE
jgi:proprotein convertase subtilisin/kexin type 5